MANRRHVKHINSNMAAQDVDGLNKFGLFSKQQPKLPDPVGSDMQNGELAVNYGTGYEAISFKNSEGDMVLIETEAALNEVADVVSSALADIKAKIESINETLSSLSLEIVSKLSLENIDSELDPDSENPIQNKAVYEALEGKQPELVSGTNIKTVNSTTLLGSGNIDADDVVNGKLIDRGFVVGQWNGPDAYVINPNADVETPSDEKLYIDVTSRRAYVHTPGGYQGLRVAVDTVPTSGSDRPITSAAVKQIETNIEEMDGTIAAALNEINDRLVVLEEAANNP